MTIHGDAILTDDGAGTSRRILITDLRRVVVATDDSGPWGDDVVYLLYSDETDPVGLFPLEANGCDDFVGWLTTQPGYREDQLVEAMASTDVATFVVFNRG